jgi:hypothetical protein
MDRERTEKGGEYVGGGLTRQGWAFSFEMLVASVSLSRFPKKLVTCRFVVEKTACLPILGESLT